MLDQTLTDENKRFYEGIKVVLSNSMHLSLSPLMKYVKRKAYADFKKGMKDWYLTGMKHTKAVKELVKNADKMGKSLDEDIGNVCFLN